jgi:hypothetical protein
MKKSIDRRRFLKIAGVSLGFGALYRVAPALAAGGEADAVARSLARRNGERVTPFSFVQLSDTRVGFSGPPNPTGTRAFERAVEVVNRLPQTPDLILFTGDLTHGTEDRNEHADRMRQFRKVASWLKVPVPGEHDAGLDGGALYREFFGESSYSLTHGLYLKPLGIDAEIEPGKTTEVTFTPRVPGRFRAICDHFCGAGHGNMHMELVVE